MSKNLYIVFQYILIKIAIFKLIFKIRIQNIIYFKFSNVGNIYLVQKQKL